MVYAQLATVYLSQSATCDACGGGGTTSVGSESDGRMGQEDGREKQKRERKREREGVEMHHQIGIFSLFRMRLGLSFAMEGRNKIRSCTKIML